MESKFYEMLRAANTFDNWAKVKEFTRLYNQLLEKEIELAQQPTEHHNKLIELLYHKLELERDILKAELEEIINKFDNPSPPPLPPRIRESKITIVRKPPAHNS